MKIEYNETAKALADGLIEEILISRDMLDQKEELLDENPDLNFPKMTDEEKFVAEVVDAIKGEKEITVYTDTDVDGIMSGIIAKKALEEAGAKVNIYTNNKLTDGYGMCKEGVENLFKLYPNTKLVLTCDLGITADDELVDMVHNAGARLVISDHHQQIDALPKAEAVCDCKRTDCVSEYKDMCGAGVIYYLSTLIYNKLGLYEDNLLPLLEYVAIATVADVVPMLGLNRNLVKLGMGVINDVPSVATACFKEQLGKNKLSARNDIGFSLAPLLNSLGRMTGDVEKAFDLFFTDNTIEAQMIIEELTELNEKRKAETERELGIAEDLLLAEYEKMPNIIILANEDFSSGIVGIVAGKLKEKYNRPCIIFKEENGKLTGSARSIDKVNIKELFDSASDFLIQYGGHAKAGGLSMDAENLSAFRKASEKYVKSICTAKDFEKVIKVDARLNNVDITFDTADMLEKLEPFGEGFEEPKIEISICPKSIEPLGSNFAHLKAIDLETDLPIIMWNGADLMQEKGDFDTAIGYPNKNRFAGRTTLQFIAEYLA